MICIWLLCKTLGVIDLPREVGAEDALSQPTRARLFALLSELRRPAGTAELAEQIGLHPNGVRMHLERMEADGLITRSRTRRTRGRPSDAWAIAPNARPGGKAPLAYRDLGRWLARAIGPGRTGLRGIEQAGRQIGRELATGEAQDGEQAFETALSSLGFQPRIDSRTDRRLTMRLENCPYRDAVIENERAVCTLHRGITRGLLETLQPQARLAGFQPRDPETAGCVVELSGLSRD